MRKLEIRDDGTAICPACGKPLRVKAGESGSDAVSQLDMENEKPRYICDECKLFFRSVLTTDYYDEFPLGEDDNPVEKEVVSAVPAPAPAKKAPGKDPVSLPPKPTGNEKCPVCGHKFRFVEGGAVRVIDGRVDMENVKPKYECDTCGVFYREVLNSGFYLPWPQEEEDRLPPKKEPETQPALGTDKTGGQGEDRPEVEPIPLPKTPKGNEVCPVCGHGFRFVEGGAVRVVDGKVDMENTKAKYECDTCGVFYREVLNSGFYLPYPQQDEDRLGKVAPEVPAGTKAENPEEEELHPLATGDLAPMILRKDENGQCRCPRCGAMMDYVEGQAVRIVDGKPDMENVLDHFHCGKCSSVFRRIVNTDYFQYSEK